MAIVPIRQTSLEETVVEDADLESALERREKAKERAAAARKTFTEADDAAKALAREHTLDDGPIRVGRFVLTERHLAGRSVAFDTEPTTRISIRVSGD